MFDCASLFVRFLSHCHVLSGRLIIMGCCFSLLSCGLRTVTFLMKVEDLGKCPLGGVLRGTSSR